MNPPPPVYTHTKPQSCFLIIDRRIAASPAHTQPIGGNHTNPHPHPHPTKRPSHPIPTWAGLGWFEHAPFCFCSSHVVFGSTSVRALVSALPVWLPPPSLSLSLTPLDGTGCCDRCCRAANASLRFASLLRRAMSSTSREEGCGLERGLHVREMRLGG